MQKQFADNSGEAVIGVTSKSFLFLRFPHEFTLCGLNRSFPGCQGEIVLASNIGARREEIMSDGMGLDLQMFFLHQLVSYDASKTRKRRLTVARDSSIRNLLTQQRKESLLQFIAATITRYDLVGLTNIAIEELVHH